MMGWFTLVRDGFALSCEVCGHGLLSWNVDQPELQKWMSRGNDENTWGLSSVMFASNLYECTLHF
jgi:hypothetical protein